MGHKISRAAALTFFLMILTLMTEIIYPCSLQNKTVLANDRDSAMDAAMELIANGDYSRLGLIEHLKFSGYSLEDAEYAADHIDADWDEMAVRSARYFISFSDYSEKGLIQHLESEGFTHEQAVHGTWTAAEGIDWNEVAAKKAEFYLRSSDFSEIGLIHQLESERIGFTHEQAVKGVEIAAKDVDWNDMAVKKAQKLLSNSNYSKKGLIHQLESESIGFTHLQAAFAAELAGRDVDWNENAVRQAEKYLETMSFTRTELIHQLESETVGFTHDQAVYGADNSGAAWNDMVEILTANLSNIFPIRGLEDKFTTPTIPFFSDVGEATTVQTINQDGLRSISLFVNEDGIHDHNVITTVNSGSMDNFMFSMDVILNDNFPGDAAGCFIGYTNESVTAVKNPDAGVVSLLLDAEGAGFYHRVFAEDSGSFKRITEETGPKAKLTIVHLTGLTYAYIDDTFAGQYHETNAGPFQLVYGALVMKNGDTADCSFDNLSVRKLMN